MKRVGSIARRLFPVLPLILALSGCGGQSDNPAGPSGPPVAGGAVVYTAVGASDAAGVGSSGVCFPFTECTNGMGYVPVIERRLKAAGATVTPLNLGIPAALIGPGFQALATQYGAGFPQIPGYDLNKAGNMIDGQAPFVQRDSTLVTIFAGGNDVRTVARALDRGAGGSDPQAFVDQQIANFRNDYRTLVGAITARAPRARIVVANLPNFAGLPYTSGYAASEKLWIQRVSVGFSTQAINPLASQGVFVVDLLCNGQFNSPSVFSSDGFHPNDTGYALLADLYLAAINASSYPPPATNCAQMTIAR